MVRRFRPEHLAELNRWYAARDLPAVMSGVLPHVGYIAPGLAAGFLYRTDSELALLDGFISNPEAPLLDRGRAISRVLEALVEEVPAGAGVSHLIGLTRVRGMEQLVERAGFSAVGGYRLFTRKVG